LVDVVQGGEVMMEPTPLEPPDPRPTTVRPADTAEPELILLVEDDFVLRGSLATVLQADGYKVESAANALEALTRLARPPKPSLILLDIMMPYMDGLEFRGLQRAAPALADIPVIVITAVGVRPDIAAELDLRQTFFKPLDRPRLLEAIRRHCPPGPG
jgi:two-component system, chemotaxis family, chemotaxis protein CheY